MPSVEIEQALRTVGWLPGRHVDTTVWDSVLQRSGYPSMHAAAQEFLGEFGGLCFPERGPGISSFREAFEIDPTLAVGEDDRFSGWSAHLGRNLYPLGELDGGRFFLGIDECREVYLVADWIARFGPANVAIEKLIYGVAPERVPRHGENGDVIGESTR